MTACEVVLYGKPDCHLCEEAWTLLVEMGQSLGLDLRIQQVDITTDPALEERYGQLIPVIALENGMMLVAPIQPEPLRRALQATR